MKKEEFCFDSRDNRTKLHAVRWMPESGNVIGVVQIVHGMAEYVERYEEFAQFLTERGFAVTGEDHLGHGGSVPEGGEQGYFCEQDPATVVVRDVHRLKKLTQELYPGVPYFIVGHSMGSFITRNYIARYGTGIDGAVIMGTGMQSEGLLFLSRMLAAVERICKGDHHVSHLIDKAAFGSYNKRIPDVKTAFDWLSRDEKKVAAYITDPDCGFVFTVNGFRTLFALISGAKKSEKAKKIPKALPVFVVSGEEDPVGDYGKGVEKAFRSLQAAGVQDLTLKLYSDDRHELLNEPDREQIMQDIWEWLAKHLVNLQTV